MAQSATVSRIVRVVALLNELTSRPWPVVGHRGEYPSIIVSAQYAADVPFEYAAPEPLAMALTVAARCGAAALTFGHHGAAVALATVRQAVAAWHRARLERPYGHDPLEP